MTSYYLAVDIGASSGRHIIGWLEDGKLMLREMYRFKNGMLEKDGVKYWDTDSIFENIKNGMIKCREAGMTPVSMGIDTWGVDFSLLDKNGKKLGLSVGYRDDRTIGMDEEVYKYIPEKELYLRTGIQKAIYNTIYQLMALKNDQPGLLDEADALLMTPDYYNYLLTGKMAAEYTISTTGQLIDPVKCDWDYELIDMLGFPRRMFLPVQKPGSVLGTLSDEVRAEVGFDCEVINIASHDTASAVLAVPSIDPDTMYISSGTWSLMGVELDKAVLTEESCEANLTNEGGYDYKYRFLKNIMGLWMIQSVMKEYDDKYSPADMCRMAEEEAGFDSIVDVDDNRFFAPESMIEAVREYCRETNQSVPETPGQIARVIYRSLAVCYGKTAQQIERITGRHFAAINIVGGGSQAEYLDRLTAEMTGKTVYAGPTEGTAIGNIGAQMLKSGEFESVAQFRRCIFESFGVKTFRN